MISLQVGIRSFIGMWIFWLGQDLTHGFIIQLTILLTRVSLISRVLLARLPLLLGAAICLCCQRTLGRGWRCLLLACES